jgi:C1A family cysteine protease
VWPFLDEKGVVRPEARAALPLQYAGGYVGGYVGGYTAAPLRARMSGLDHAAGRPAVSLGWHPDVPDIRDKHAGRSGARRRFEVAARKVKRKWQAKPPAQWGENLQWCSPVEDQDALGSCTAQAVVGLAEYMQRRAGIRHVDGSRLFVYKVSRRLLGWTGDTGAYLRTAMKAVAAFGIPPEQYYPYDISRYDEEPTAFLYSFAQNYQFLKYVRIDTADRDPDTVLVEVKRVLAAGLCSVFGFSVYSSLSNAPDIPYPTPADSLEGGHAVMAVGYDDNHVNTDGSKGALIIRNSWGTNWGIGGYGFLPYRYVTTGLARDFWTALKSEWIELEKFEEA